MPQITVVIPAYNSMQYLPATLESVFQQTFVDFEIVVVNDGSTDNTQEYVSSLTDSRLKIVFQENKGLAAARNIGIAHARGEYIAFLDADDLWESTKLEKQLRILDNNPEVGVVYTWVAYVNERGKKTGRIFKDRAEGQIWKELTIFNIVRCGSVPMVRKVCFETCGTFDCNLNSAVEDWDMWLRIANKYHFKAIKEPLVYYRQHETSCSKNWQAMSKSFHLAIEKNFVSVDPNLMYLKRISYGFAYICLAWKPLQSQDKDYKQAAKFCHKAVEYYPALRFSQEYIRLNLAILLMRFLKPQGYARIQPLLYALRKLKPQ